jgi:GTP diphosphokinase / guanosine-3',5'-bis(diphosphate) 3'-diphosphatase
MRIDTLMNLLPSNYTPADREMVMRAYRVAEQAHREQKRASGEPYVNHCIIVAGILAEMRVPPSVVAAGLLHDTVEDTDVTLADLNRDFGEEIARLVDGVTKLTHLPQGFPGRPPYGRPKHSGRKTADSRAARSTGS